MKKIGSRLLLVFIIFSISFLAYKEFVRGGNEKKIKNTEIQLQNPVSHKPPGSKASQEIVSKPKNEASPLQAALQPAKSKVIAYYFHGTYRCTTCRTIEQYSHDTIHQYFSKELGDGKLEFKPLNVEDPENRHYIQDYQLFTKSLVIAIYKDNKQVKWKNLEDVWKLVRGKEKFYKYVKDEIEEFLKAAE